MPAPFLHVQLLDGSYKSLRQEQQTALLPGSGYVFSFKAGDVILLPPTVVHGGAMVTYEEIKPKVRRVAIHATLGANKAVSYKGDTYFFDWTVMEWLQEVKKCLKEAKCLSILTGADVNKDHELKALYAVYNFWDMNSSIGFIELAKKQDPGELIGGPSNLTVLDYHRQIRSKLALYDKALEMQQKRWVQFCLHLALKGSKMYGSEELIVEFMPKVGGTVVSLNAQLYKAIRGAGNYFVSW
jgi:hypothetical protein